MKHTLFIVMAGLGTLSVPVGCNSTKGPATQATDNSSTTTASTPPEVTDAPTPDCPADIQNGAACDGSIEICVLTSDEERFCPDPMYDCNDGKWRMLPMPTCNPPPPPPRPKPIKPPEE